MLEGKSVTNPRHFIVLLGWLWPARQRVSRECPKGVLFDTSNGSHDVFHPTFLTPYLRSFALPFDFIAVNATWIFYLDKGFSAINVFHNKIWHVSAQVFLNINPLNTDTVPLAFRKHERHSMHASVHPYFNALMVIYVVDDIGG